MRFSQSTHMFMRLSLETLTSIIRIGLPILVKPIDLVNSVMIFLSQTTFLRRLTLLLGSQTVILAVLLFWIYLSLLTLFVLQWLLVHWEILIMLLSQFPLTFHHIQSWIPCLTALLMTIPVLIGTVFMIIWEMFHEKIFLNSVLLLLVVNFVSGLRLELIYLFLIENTRSSLAHLYGFQLVELLSWSIEITFFVSTKRINLLNLK